MVRFKCDWNWKGGDDDERRYEEGGEKVGEGDNKEGSKDMKMATINVKVLMVNMIRFVKKSTKKNYSKKNFFNFFLYLVIDIKS